MHSSSSSSRSVFNQKLHTAVLKGNLKSIEYYVETMKVNVNSPLVKDGDTALHVAAETGNIEVIKLLKKLGAVHKPTPEGEYPIHTAAYKGNIEAINFFVKEMGVNVDRLDDDSDTALHIAAGEVHALDTVKVLIALGAKHLPNAKGNYPIHNAASHDCNATVEYLVLECGVDVNIRGHLGLTALHYAANKPKTLASLIDLNPAHLASDSGSYPLHRAAAYDAVESVELLVRRLKVDVNLRTNGISADSAFHICAANNSLKVARLLKQLNATYQINANLGSFPLLTAAEHDRADLVRFFVQEMKVDVNQVSIVGTTPLRQALSSGSKHACRELLKLGATYDYDDFYAASSIASSIDVFVILYLDNLNKKLVSHETFVSRSFIRCFETFRASMRLPLLTCILANQIDINASFERLFEEISDGDESKFNTFITTFENFNPDRLIEKVVGESKSTVIRIAEVRREYMQKSRDAYEKTIELLEDHKALIPFVYTCRHPSTMFKGAPQELGNHILAFLTHGDPKVPVDLLLETMKPRDGAFESKSKGEHQIHFFRKMMELKYSPPKPKIEYIPFGNKRYKIDKKALQDLIDDGILKEVPDEKPSFTPK